MRQRRTGKAGIRGILIMAALFGAFAAPCLPGVLFAPLAPAAPLDSFVWAIALAAPEAGEPGIDVAPRVEWEERFTWAHSGGAYPRLLRLDNGDLLLAFDLPNPFSGKTDQKVIRSRDGGATWSRSVTVASNPRFDYANGQMIQRPDGAVLMAYREVAAGHRTLKVSISYDRGETWEELSEIVSHPNGVWEPHMILLPDGEIQVYYASEAYQPAWPQVIEMKRSADGGATWSEPVVASYAAGSRDGMPVAEILENGDIFVVFEADTPFVVRSVRSTDRGRTWGPRTLVYAAPSTVAAAPYVIRTPGGDLVVAFQVDEGGMLRMQTVVSRDGGKTWGPPTYGNVPGVWNALFMLDSETILGASSGIVLRKGRVVPERGDRDGAAAAGGRGDAASGETAGGEGVDEDAAAERGDPGAPAPDIRISWNGWTLHDRGSFKWSGPATVYVGAGIDEERISRVLVEIAPVVSGVPDRSRGVLVYEGSTYPRSAVVDTRAFEDGGYEVMVRLEAGGETFEHSRRVTFDNWTELVDELPPPLRSPWFGEVDRKRAVAASDGWVHVGDRPEAFGGDDSRLVRQGEAPEFLVWEADRLRKFSLTLYAQEEAHLGAISIGVSADGENWTLLAPDLRANPGSGKEWFEYVLSADVDEASGARYLRVEVSGTSLAPDAVQLGRVVIYSPVEN